ncbi:hypothetical protein D3C76_1542490 [compost metagenome]
MIVSVFVASTNDPPAPNTPTLKTPVKTATFHFFTRFPPTHFFLNKGFLHPKRDDIPITLLFLSIQ